MTSPPPPLTPRDRLLAAAVDYAALHGISDVSLRTLAAGLGTSHRMLIHHFGSKDGLLAAVVTEVERRQRDALIGLQLDPAADPAEIARGSWERFSDPALWPFERLFFELYAQALQGRSHTVAPTEDLIEPWITPVADFYVRRGLSASEARATARLGIAVTRGLLLDLLATGDREGVGEAMDLFIAMGVAAAASADPSPD